jgi:aryl-alcohol dehydrogenase-like predicted oxidoreductase
LTAAQRADWHQSIGAVERIAAACRCTPAQLALARLLARTDGIIPMPGTKHLAHLGENLGAAGVALTVADIAAPGQAFAPDLVAGHCCSEASMR